MRRREFIALVGSAAAWPLAARAHQTAKVPRVGYLSPGSPPASQAFWQGMRDLGYVEGKNIFVEYRWAEGEPPRLPDLAEELTRLNVDVIFALGSQATFAVTRWECWNRCRRPNRDPRQYRSQGKQAAARPTRSHA